MIPIGIAVGFVVLILLGRRLSVSNRTRWLVRGLVTVNALIVLLTLMVMALQWLGTPLTAVAGPAPQEGEGLTGTVALAAALSTGLAALASGIAVAIVGSAAVGAVSENPENLGRTLIFVGLAEGIAIYGLITSFLILTR